MNEEALLDQESGVDYDLMLAQAFQAKIDENISAAERELGGVTKFTFMKHADQPDSGRMYVVQGPGRYATFMTWLGFADDDFPGVAIYIGEVEYHDGEFGGPA